MQIKDYNGVFIESEATTINANISRTRTRGNSINFQW